MRTLDVGASRMVCWLISGGTADAVDDVQRVRHNQVHVDQWRRFGALGFVRRYLTAYVHGRLRGYGHAGAGRRVPLEVEAQWEASSHLGGIVDLTTSPVRSPATEEPTWSPTSVPTTEPTPPPGVTASS